MGRFFNKRNLLILVLCLDMTLALRIGILTTMHSIPDEINLFCKKVSTYEFALPVQMRFDAQTGDELYVNGESGKTYKGVTDCISMQAQSIGGYHAKVNLFGIIPLKEVDIKVSEPVALYPVGKCAGIYVETDGVMVLGTGEIEVYENVGDSKAKLSMESPAKNILKAGDYIRAVNDTDINGYDEMSQIIQQCKDDKIKLTVLREDELISVVVRRVLGTDGIYKLGIWVRENLQGIGTLTYVDEDGNYAALGHGINDSTSGLIMKIKSGELYRPYVRQIIKGRKNNPGELYGIISYQKKDYLGIIGKNTDCGIFGKVNEEALKDLSDNTMPVPIKLKDEIHEGSASVICDVGEGRKYYDIEIVKVNMNGDKKKNMVIKITDEKLIDITGGIVQGMSGTPIIQDGCLVGAVTHVFVDKPDMGYAIFVEEMIDHENF